MVALKATDTPLTVKLKERIKHDLNTNTEMKQWVLLLDTCAFLNPHFKYRFSIEVNQW